MMKHWILSRTMVLILICSLFCSMFCLPTPARAKNTQENFTAHYDINAHWVEKDGLKDQYAELDLLIQMPFLRSVKEPMDVLFIADVSSSMDNPVKGEYPSLGHYNTLTPLAAVTDGMDHCAGFLSDSPTAEDRFGLIAFSSEVDATLDFTDNAAAFSREILHLASKDNSRNYYAALTAAKEMLANRADKSRPAHVIFMTDGEPDIQRAQAAAALADLAGYADIYAVQFGCTVDMLSGATKTYRVDTPEEMLNAVPFALSDIAQCGKWSPVNIAIPSSGDFVIGQASPAETYGTSVIDASGIKYTGTDVPSGVTYALHYPLTLADPDTLKTELTVNTGGTFNFASPGEQPSPSSELEVMTLDRPRYTVTYDGNSNTAGTVPVDNNRYAPGTMIEYPDVGDLKKEVDGKTYQFQGWRIKQPSVNKDYGSHFSIYGDTILEAIWTTATTVAKTSNTKGKMPDPILMRFVHPDSNSELVEAFHQRQYKQNIVSVTFLDRINIPTTAEASWDVSEAKNGSVMAWVTPGTAAGTYDLFIAGNSRVIANPDSSYLFGGTIRTLIGGGEFRYCFDKLERISGLENLDTSRVTNMESMFRFCSAMESLDLSSLDMSSVTSMAAMFDGCTSLTAIPTMPQDLSSLTNVSSMFNKCSGLTSADLSGWNTGSITNMYAMFQLCSGLTTIPTPPADTSNLTNMSNMFSYCNGLTDPDLSGWDTSSVTNMSSMFFRCYGLTTIPTPPADTSNLTNMSCMFAYCDKLTNADLSGWDTGSVTNMGDLFSNCSGLTNADLSGWDISSVTDMFGLFGVCTGLTTIDISGWDLSRVNNIGEMFCGCTNLTSIGTTTITVAQNCYTRSFQLGSALPPITINCTGAASRAANAAMTALADDDAQPDTQALIIPDNDVQAPASMTTKTVRATSGPKTVDMGEIKSGDEINYQITVQYEGDNGPYSGDIKITDPIPDGLTVKPDSISITATRVYPSDGLRASYLVKQTPQVNDGILTLCLTGISNGSQVVISYTCTTPDSIATTDYKQFLNTAVMETDGRTAYTDTIRHWIGPTPEADALYNVSYEYDGSVPENAPALPQKVKYMVGDTVTVAPTPSLPGYTFNGWKRQYIDDDPVTSFIMIDTDIKLIGTWTEAPENVPKTVKVKYEYRGDVPAGVPALPAERSYNINNFAIIAAQPVSDDYTFDGWYCDDSDKVSAQDLLDGRFYVGETDTVLYGSWSPKTYKVSYEYTGTVPADAPALPAEQTYVWGTTVTGAAAPADTAEYSFSGWTTTADLDAAPPYASFTMPKEDVVFRGSWTKKTYSVKYVYTGTVPEGAQALLPAADTFYPSDTVSVAAAPILAGYTFSGWSVQSGLADGAVTNGSFTMPAGDVIFQGSWQKPSGGGGSHSGSSRPTKAPAALNTEEHTNYIIGRDGGYMKPLAEINRAETATIFFRLLTEDYRNEVWTESCDYPDVNSTAWHNLAISTLTNAGILNGYPDGTFRPDAPITRAEFAAIAARFDSTEYSGEALFPDVAGHWAADAIYRSAQKGWIKGYPDGTFRPDQDITRAEAITLINRVLNRDGEALGDLVKDAIKWRDVAADAWYYDAIREATNSHSYQRVDNGEQWLKIESPTDWHSIESSRSKAAK